MFPKKIFNISYLSTSTYKPDFPKLILTKESDLQKVAIYLLDLIEGKVNYSLSLFMYEVQDKMDYLIQYDEDSEFYYKTVCNVLGEKELLVELENAGAFIPNFELEDTTATKLFQFLFEWIPAAYTFELSKGFNSMKTEQNIQHIIDSIKNYNYEDEVPLVLTPNEVEIRNLFNKVIRQMKEFAPVLTAYLEKHDYFNEVQKAFENDKHTTMYENIHIHPAYNTVFFN